ncbi:type II/IV secretion system ATPase subunit [Halosegnis sp.]|uniref:type II/IV secretion system ATPase subunit n=1 Tax=Halosegnis sp. TaxID=2864959 RepID=UPI0035D4AB8E
MEGARDVEHTTADIEQAVLADLRAADALDDVDQPARQAFFRFDHLADVDVERWYWLRAPFAWTAVCRDPETGEQLYLFTEPALNEFERFARRDLTVVVRDELLDEPVTDDRPTAFERRLDDVLATHHADMSTASLAKLRYYLRRDFLRFGSIDAPMHDPAVEDISCDGTDVPLFVYHAEYGHLRTDRQFSADELDSLAIRLAQRCGRHVSASEPLMTDTLPDGSRVQLTLGSDVAVRGSNFTVRKFATEPFTPLRLARTGTLSLAQLAYLWLCVAHSRSVLFVGPTAAGKTTSMNATALFIPPDHKTVSIERTREVQLPHDNWIANVTRETSPADEGGISVYELLSEALHQRPDHVVVGELRTDPRVANGFFQAMGTGHAGFTTFHAESAGDALRRLRHEPLAVAEELLTDLDVVVQAQVRVDGERVRRCRQLCEVQAGDDGTATLRPVFEYDPYDDRIEQTAPARVPRAVATDAGWTDERLRADLARRIRFLAGLLAADIKGYDAVTDRLFRFARDPDRALAAVEPDRPLPTVEV